MRAGPLRGHETASTYSAASAAERLGRHSHAERGNEELRTCRETTGRCGKLF